MKKSEKRINAVRGIRAAIDDSMARHPSYKYEYCDVNCNCNECCDTSCSVAPFMVSFYDHNNHYLVGNWLANSYNGISYSNSGLINALAEYFDIDVPHLMWDEADEILHRIRYIKIGIRNSIEDENGYFYYIETGLKYDIHKRTIERYRNKWYCEPEVNEEWKSGCF